MIFYVYGSIAVMLVNSILQFLCCLVVSQGLLGMRGGLFCISGIFSIVLAVTGFRVLYS